MAPLCSWYSLLLLGLIAPHLASARCRFSSQSPRDQFPGADAVLRLKYDTSVTWNLPCPLIGYNADVSADEYSRYPRYTIVEIFKHPSLDTSYQVGDDVVVLYSTDTGFRKMVPYTLRDDPEGFVAYLNPYRYCSSSAMEESVTAFSLSQCNRGNRAWSTLSSVEQSYLRSQIQNTPSPTTLSPTTSGPTTSRPATPRPTPRPTTMAPTTPAPTPGAIMTPRPTTLEPTTPSPTTAAPTPPSSIIPPFTRVPTTSPSMVPTTIRRTLPPQTFTLEPSGSPSMAPTTNITGTLPPQNFTLEPSVSPSMAPTTSTMPPSNNQTMPPMTEGPSTDSPSTTDMPMTEDPSTDITEGPSSGSPSTDMPMTEGPTEDATETEMPKTEGPTVTPETNMPSTEMPTDNGSSTDSPSTETEMPMTEGPTTATETNMPSTEMPTDDGSSTDSPSTGIPMTGSPTVLPETNMPLTDMPTEGGSSSISPSTEDPSTISSSTEDPSTEDPSTISPSTEDPSTISPSTEDPSIISSSTEDPSTISPSTEDPSTISTSIEDPSTISPSNSTPSPFDFTFPPEATNDPFTIFTHSPLTEAPSNGSETGPTSTVAPTPAPTAPAAVMLMTAIEFQFPEGQARQPSAEEFIDLACQTDPFFTKWMQEEAGDPFINATSRVVQFFLIDAQTMWVMIRQLIAPEFTTPNVTALETAVNEYTELDEMDYTENYAQNTMEGSVFRDTISTIFSASITEDPILEALPGTCESQGLGVQQQSTETTQSQFFEGTTQAQLGTNAAAQTTMLEELEIPVFQADSAALNQGLGARPATESAQSQLGGSSQTQLGTNAAAQTTALEDLEPPTFQADSSALNQGPGAQQATETAQSQLGTNAAAFQADSAALNQGLGVRPATETAQSQLGDSDQSQLGTAAQITMLEDLEVPDGEFVFQAAKSKVPTPAPITGTIHEVCMCRCMVTNTQEKGLQIVFKDDGLIEEFGNTVCADRKTAKEFIRDGKAECDKSCRSPLKEDVDPPEPSGRRYLRAA